VILGVWVWVGMYNAEHGEILLLNSSERSWQELGRFLFVLSFFFLLNGGE